MKKIRFVTLHPQGVNVDLMKDEGQIPYTLSKNYNVDATIVACNIDKNANYDSVPGLKVKHIPKIINYPISGLLYIIFNAKRIDWLNVYFAGRQAYIWMKLFKFLNPKGKTYLKLDMDFRSIELYKNNKKEKEIFEKNSKIADIISVESTAIRNIIQEYSHKDILVIRDGISKQDFEFNLNKKRNNTFITVGRLGTEQKATDLLLEAFAMSYKKHNWDLLLIGSIEKSFYKYIDNYFIKYPDLKNRVKFIGVINDRKELYSEYCKAKVFVLPSRWESFGISCGEALSCGCYLLLSNNIPPAFEMTNGEKFGKIVDANVETIANEMINITKKDITMDMINDMNKYASKLFSWDLICSELFDKMMEVNEGKNEN